LDALDPAGDVALAVDHDQISGVAFDRLSGGNGAVGSVAKHP